MSLAFHIFFTHPLFATKSLVLNSLASISSFFSRVFVDVEAWTVYSNVSVDVFLCGSHSLPTNNLHDAPGSLAVTRKH